MASGKPRCGPPAGAVRARTRALAQFCRGALNIGGGVRSPGLPESRCLSSLAGAVARSALTMHRPTAARSGASRSECKIGGAASAFGRRSVPPRMVNACVRRCRYAASRRRLRPSGDRRSRRARSAGRRSESCLHAPTPPVRAVGGEPPRAAAARPQRQIAGRRQPGPRLRSNEGTLAGRVRDGYGNANACRPFEICTTMYCLP